jgi:hypothetical protein
MFEFFERLKQGFQGHAVTRIQLPVSSNLYSYLNIARYHRPHAGIHDDTVAKLEELAIEERRCPQIGFSGQ